RWRRRADSRSTHRSRCRHPPPHGRTPRATARPSASARSRRGLIRSRSSSPGAPRRPGRDHSSGQGYAPRAMSEADVELVRRGFEALEVGDAEALIPLVHPEFEMTTPAGLAAEPDTYRGQEGVRRYFDSFYE